MSKQDTSKLFALICNSLDDLTAKERNKVAQLCINLNRTTSVKCYSEALRIPIRTVQQRITNGAITFLKIGSKKFPSIKIIN